MEANTEVAMEEVIEEAIFHKIQTGDAKAIRALLQRHNDLDLNAGTWAGTLLHEAVAAGTDEVLELLAFDPRTDASITNYARVSAFWVACHLGATKKVKILLMARKDTPLNQRMGFTNETPREVAQKKSNVEVVELLDDYALNPEKVRHQIMVELGKAGEKAAKIYCQIVLASDGYLKMPSAEGWDRFFQIALRLPIELQMVLGNRYAGLPRDLIPSGESERAFRTIAQGFES